LEVLAGLLAASVGCAATCHELAPDDCQAIPGEAALHAHSFALPTVVEPEPWPWFFPVPTSPVLPKSASLAPTGAAIEHEGEMPSPIPTLEALPPTERSPIDGSLGRQNAPAGEPSWAFQSVRQRVPAAQSARRRSAFPPERQPTTSSRRTAPR
jgi:hypothetical protein